MAAQHQIDTRTVEDRQELLRHIQIAVPCVLDLRGNMVEDDPSFGVLPLITLHHALEPFGLLVQIRLRAEPSLVLDVAVHLVLAAVQHQKQELAIFKGVVGAVLREVEIFRDPEGLLASVLVVAAGHKQRSLGREEVAGRRGTPVSGEVLPAHESGQRGAPVSGKALPAHEASQRGAPVSGEALPAHEAGQLGTPVSGKALPAHEAISERGLGRSAF